MSEKQETTNFGYQEVPTDLKQKLVNQVFSSVADKYDLMNDVMSLGIHRLWKKFLLNQIKAQDKLQILDMAAGTGDLSFAAYQKLQSYGYESNIILADISKEMLEVAKKRAIDKNILPNQLEFKVVNGESLDFADNKFDYYLIAYGIRNFTDRKTALKEAFRTLNKGGKFLCLEFSQIPNPILRKAYDFYSFNFIPKIGGLISGDSGSYEYFVESIRKFPKPDEFCLEIAQAGFQNVRTEAYSFGISNLYIAEK